MEQLTSKKIKEIGNENLKNLPKEGKNEDKSESRISIRFDLCETEILKITTEKLKELGINLKEQMLIRYLVRTSEPDSLSKRIAKSKSISEEILKKAEQEAGKVWF